MRYLNLTKKEGYHWGMMRGIWSSAANLAVVQAQDLLGLGHESRMNTPSTLGGTGAGVPNPVSLTRGWPKSCTVKWNCTDVCRNENSFVLWCRLVFRAGSAA